MMTKIVIEPQNPHNPLDAELFEGQVQKFTIDADMWAVREGGALSTAVWSVEDGNVSIGANTEATNVSTANITVSQTGTSLVKVLLTLDASGGDQVYTQYIKILVKVIDRTTERYWW